MAVVIPDEIFSATHLTEKELKQEIALMLFSRDKLTLAQAAKLAEMDRLSFHHLLASRKIPLHYGVADLEHDVKTLQELGRL
jgi:predicted HTH domain antitoxin